MTIRNSTTVNKIGCYSISLFKIKSKFFAEHLIVLQSGPISHGDYTVKPDLLYLLNKPFVYNEMRNAYKQLRGK